MPYVGRPPATGPYLKLDDISDEFDGSKVTFNITLGGSGGGGPGSGTSTPGGNAVTFTGSGGGGAPGTAGSGGTGIVIIRYLA
jgi:hypothetical protein